MTTYQGLIDSATKRLYKSSDTPKIDAEYLLQSVVGQPLAWLILHGDRQADRRHVSDFTAKVDRRCKGEPIAYILGERDFWTLTLKVDDRVLIPRPDTETLVETALAYLPKDLPLRVLDLGTGSGAIALAIAKERPRAELIAVDAQPEALSVAKSNAQANQLTNVDFIQSHWFTELSNENKFDLIASNPPYVDASDAHLGAGDLRFEPNTALVSDEGGYGDLRRIIVGAKDFLKPNGALALEHGYQQAEGVANMLQAHGYSHIKLEKDLNQLPRCTHATLTGRPQT